MIVDCSRAISRLWMNLKKQHITVLEFIRARDPDQSAAAMVSAAERGGLGDGGA